MAAYTELINRVRDWSNRDREVLSDANIGIFIQFAADEAYRQLRIPSVECIVEYNIDSDAAGSNKLGIPAGATEFIQLRKKDPNSITGYVTYDAKADIRSFYNEELWKYGYYFYTRQQNNLIVCPDMVAGETYELYYYGRAPRVADTDSDAVNWLRDQNQKILLFGALAEAFDYLNEPEDAARFRARFQAEIVQLNNEEMMRKSRGGNIQTHFAGPLL